MRRQAPDVHAHEWDADLPCQCAVCRTDRFVDRVGAVIIGFALGYFGGHLLIHVLAR